MAKETNDRLDLRGAARDAVRAQVADRALVLFDEQGFEGTTVEDVVRAVGISARSFFRYFPTKEDVVVRDPAVYGRQVLDAFTSRPAGEDPWDAIRAALHTLTAPDATGRGLMTMRVIMRSPSLRARHLEKHLAWARLLEPAALERVGSDAETRRLRAHMLINGALACLDVAFAEWVDTDGAIELAELLDQAFAALTQAGGRRTGA